MNDKIEIIPLEEGSIMAKGYNISRKDAGKAIRRYEKKECGLSKEELCQDDFLKPIYELVTTDRGTDEIRYSWKSEPFNDEIHPNYRYDTVIGWIYLV